MSHSSDSAELKSEPEQKNKMDTGAERAPNETVADMTEATRIDMSTEQNTSQLIPLLNQQVMEEYVTQFFGFTPKSFCDSIYNALYDALHDGVDAFQSSLLLQFKNIVTEEELCLGGKKILEAVIPKAEKSCEKLETYLMKNLFFIPNNMLLPEDEIHRNVAVKSEDEKLLDREIEALEKEFLNGQYMIHCLQQQKRETDAAIEEYSKMCKLLEDLEKIYVDQGISAPSDIQRVRDDAEELTAAIKEIETDS